MFKKTQTKAHRERDRMSAKSEREVRLSQLEGATAHKGCLQSKIATTKKLSKEMLF